MKDLKHLKTFESFSIVEKKSEVKEKEEKSTISKEDEKKYLSPKQAKLPEGLKKGIIAKAKKEEKKK